MSSASNQFARVLKWLLLPTILHLSASVFASGGGEETKAVNEYLNITPAFVTNFGGAGKMRYLRIEVVLRMNEPQTAAPIIDKHMPLVKHAIIMLMSEQVEEDLMTMEGKEILRQATLEEVRKIYAEQAKELKEPIKDVLFSSFIIQ
jgi:flagellar FliL protein